MQPKAPDAGKHHRLRDLAECFRAQVPGPRVSVERRVQIARFLIGDAQAERGFVEMGTGGQGGAERFGRAETVIQVPAQQFQAESRRCRRRIARDGPARGILRLRQPSAAPCRAGRRRRPSARVFPSPRRLRRPAKGDLRRRGLLRQQGAAQFLPALREPGRLRACRAARWRPGPARPTERSTAGMPAPAPATALPGPEPAHGRPRPPPARRGQQVRQSQSPARTGIRLAAFRLFQTVGDPLMTVCLNYPVPLAREPGRVFGPKRPNRAEQQARTSRAGVAVGSQCGSQGVHESHGRAAEQGRVPAMVPQVGLCGQPNRPSSASANPGSRVRLGPPRRRP